MPGLAALLPGCAIVSTEQLGAGLNARSEGISYMLPKAILPIQVVDSGGALRMDVLDPVMIGDPDLPLTLRYHPNAFSSDTAKIEIDPNTSLLKTVTLESKDETGEILKKVAQVAFRPESADGAAETVVFMGYLDPSAAASMKVLGDDIEAAVTAHVTAQRAACSKTQTPACATYESLGAKTGAIAAAGVQLLANTGAGKTAAPAADCSVGICYRSTVPYALSLNLYGQKRQTVIQLPNHAPVMALPLGRQPFVKVKHTVALKAGVLETYETDKPSSALAIVSWPLDVFDAIVTSTSKILQFKIDTSKQSVELEQQLLAAEKALRDIQNERANAAQPEGFGLLKMGKSNAVLSVQVGAARQSSLPQPGPGFGTGAAVPTPPQGGGAGTINPGSDGKK